MACLIKNQWGLHYSGITAISFELEVWGSNPGPAKPNLKLHTCELSFAFAKVAAGLLWGSKFLNLALHFGVISWVPVFSWVSIKHTLVGFESKIMCRFSIQIVFDIGYEKYRQKFNINFLGQRFEKSIVLCLWEFTYLPVKRLRVLLREEENLGSLKN